jgi:tetratricopeptide (TPR) repeat protein
VGTAAEKNILDNLGTRLEGQVQQANINRALAEAEAYIQQGKNQEALTLLRDAMQQYSNDPKLQSRLAALSRQVSYDTAIANAQHAVTTNNLPAAITEYEKARALRPSQELTDTILKLRAKLSLQRGYEQLSSGDREAARASFTEAASLDPANGEAKAALQQIQTANQRELFISSGETAFTAGDYQAAINHFNNAQAINTTPEVQARINAARLRLTVAQAREAMESGNLDLATTRLDAAMAMQPTDAQANAVMEELSVRRNYREHLTNGDGLRDKSLFDDALSEYRKAREAIKGSSIAPDEINQRLTDTEYENLMAQARHAIEARKWPQAKALLKTAQKMRDTQAIRTLLEQVDANEKSSS